MTFDDLKLVSNKITGAKRFGHWIYFRDQRKQIHQTGRKGRKELINFFESRLGILGHRWNYQRADSNGIILKINEEKDFLFFLLRLI
jgi:hypothetical protein